MFRYPLYTTAAKAAPDRAQHRAVQLCGWPTTLAAEPDPNAGMLQPALAGRSTDGPLRISPVGFKPEAWARTSSPTQVSKPGLVVNLMRHQQTQRRHHRLRAPPEEG